jgi:hypothetical protein
VFPRTRAAVAERVSRRWWRWALPALGMLAAASACLFLITPTRPANVDLLEKGSRTLAIFAARDQSVLPVADDHTKLRSGDRIRFVLWPAGHRFALIASVDGAGKPTIYFPFQGTRSAALPAGPRVELPGSILLDESPGPERVFAVLSPAPLAAATVLDALKVLASKGGDAVRRTAALPIEGVAQQSILFEKQP